MLEQKQSDSQQRHFSSTQRQQSHNIDRRHLNLQKVLITLKRKNGKRLSSTRVSRAVPHLSTNRALSRLTSEFGWDPVHLAQYGRQRLPTSEMAYKVCGSFRPILKFSYFPVHMVAEMLGSGQDSVSEVMERVREEVVRHQAGELILAIVEVRLENSVFVDSILVCLYVSLFVILYIVCLHVRFYSVCYGQVSNEITSNTLLWQRQKCVFEWSVAPMSSIMSFVSVVRCV